MPFELQMDSNSVIVQFRERSYDYPGSPGVYTNTLTSTYNREVKIDGGLHYVDVIRGQLANAWKNEQRQTTDSPSRQNH